MAPAPIEKRLASSASSTISNPTITPELNSNEKASHGGGNGTDNVLVGPADKVDTLPSSQIGDGNSTTAADDLEALEDDPVRLAAREGIQPVFYAKVLVLNKAMSELGMGRYQWELFVSSGFGWFADNLCEFSPVTTGPHSSRPPTQA